MWAWPKRPFDVLRDLAPSMWWGLFVERLAPLNDPGSITIVDRIPRIEPGGVSYAARPTMRLLARAMTSSSEFTRITRKGRSSGSMGQVSNGGPIENETGTRVKGGC